MNRDSKYDRDNRIMDRMFVIALIFCLLGLAGIVGITADKPFSGKFYFEKEEIK